MKTEIEINGDVDANKWCLAVRVLGIFWKCARVGERLSPYVSVCCFVMAVGLPAPLLQDHPRYGEADLLPRHLCLWVNNL